MIRNQGEARLCVYWLMEDDFLQKLKAGDRSALGELHRR